MTAAVAVGGSVLVASPAHAATFEADETGELADAIIAANANPGPDTIILSGSGFTPTSSLPAITDSLSIVGPGSGAFTLDMGFEVAFVSEGPPTNPDNTSLSVTGITVENLSGALIDTENVDVVLNDVVAPNNLLPTFVTHDGGDFSATDLDLTGGPGEGPGVGVSLTVGTGDVVDLTRVTVSDTDDTGIEVTASGDAALTLSDVTAAGNSLGIFGGGGLVAELSGSSAMSVENSRVTNNGFYGLDVTLTETASLVVSDSEFSDNDGDGLFVNSGDASTATITGSTADRNDADGFDVDGDDAATVTIRTSSASDNGDNGFESNVNGGTGFFENVTSQGNEDDGFDMEADDGSTLTLTNPVALDNGDNGITAEPDTDDSSVIVNGGRAEGNQDYGLFMNVDRGTVTVTDLVSRDNSGGGVNIDGFNGQATLRDSTVTGNGSGFLFGAGGVEIDADTSFGVVPLEVLIENTTISDNTGNEGGIGGRVIEGSTLTVLNSTISGNEGDQGGGIDIEGDSDSELTIAHSTIALNESDDVDSGGVDVSGLGVTITHSILAGNLAAGAPSDLVESDSTLDIDYSLVEVADAMSTAALTAGTGNIVGQGADLGPLADNGGPTLTHLPSASSPALNAGDAAITGAPATDQRGEDRIVDVIDIGAVEVQPESELAATGPDESALLVGGAAALLLLWGAVLVAVSRSRSTALRR